ADPEAQVEEPLHQRARALGTADGVEQVQDRVLERERGRDRRAAEAALAPFLADEARLLIGRGTLQARRQAAAPAVCLSRRPAAVLGYLCRDHSHPSSMMSLIGPYTRKTGVSSGAAAPVASPRTYGIMQPGTSGCGWTGPVHPGTSSSHPLAHRSSMMS